MSLAPGQTLSHYRLIEKIGEGGMGVVYRAHDTRLERDVALKVLTPGLLDNEASRKRFRKEALALSKLNHPNIATVFDFDTQDGTDFLVMEYISGTTLDKKLAEGALSENEVVRLATQLCEGLTAAHGQGVLHRDLKPGNLRVTPDGRLKILDFGLAKLLQPTEELTQAETVTETRGVVGTPAYMAPEQLGGESVDARTDIWGLGVVLYEMAGGQRPFRGETPTKLSDAILHETPVTPRATNPSVSPDLERIVLKCLEKDPETRYQSVKETAVDLRRLNASGEAVIPAPVPPRPRRWLHVAIGVAVIALATILATRLLNTPGPPTPEGGKVMLAVLPFENLSADPEQEYFSDGMTEEMIAHLGRLQPESLGVIARTSAMHYKDTDQRIDEIGSELGVQYLLEGSVRRAEERVRITAQLIQVSDQTHLWAENYERDLADVFAVQNEVAGHIADSLALELLPEQKARLTNAPRINPEAHKAYLKGKYHLNRRTSEDLHLAIQHLENAVTIEPTYALGYAALADAYNVQPMYHSMSSREVERGVLVKAEEATHNALKYAPNLAEAHLQLAETLWFDWDAADEEYNRAIELDANSALAHHYYSTFLAIMRRFEESLVESQRAATLDPLSVPIKANLAGSLSRFDRLDEAIEEIREAVELSPRYSQAHRRLAVYYLRTGKVDEAVAEFSNWLNIRGRGDEVRQLEQAIRADGLRGLYRWELDDLKQRSTREYISPVMLATKAAGLGQSDLAISLLEEAYQENEQDWQLASISYLTVYDDLRADPRFQDLLRRLGLPID